MCLAKFQMESSKADGFPLGQWVSLIAFLYQDEHIFSNLFFMGYLYVVMVCLTERWFKNPSNTPHKKGHFAYAYGSCTKPTARFQRIQRLLNALPIQKRDISLPFLNHAYIARIIAMLGWEGRLAVKSAYRSYRGPEFSSLHPHWRLTTACD